MYLKSNIKSFKSIINYQDIYQILQVNLKIL